jgi:hypothetical protein
MRRVFTDNNSNHFIFRFTVIFERKNHLKMNGAEINPFTIDSYFGLLKNLSQDNKLELIARLSDSMKKNKKPSKRSVTALFGALKTRQSAETIIAEIKTSRTFKQKRATL